MSSVALITGASDGIGYELAKCFARDGSDLVLVARSRDRLERAASGLSRAHGGRVSTMVQDLSTREGACEVFEEVRKRHLEVDFLVNNAGVGTYGLFAETDLERELRMMQLN
ncbi:MAG TPA: SDR family NAD(P)-dependent oxidoreductase, partial [Burkholderiales bacterium]|nr:SDR family NAD(P)-dependent oxidoreductase [Burkholderiales bacterium]